MQTIIGLDFSLSDCLFVSNNLASSCLVWPTLSQQVTLHFLCWFRQQTDRGRELALFRHPYWSAVGSTSALSLCLASALASRGAGVLARWRPCRRTPEKRPMRLLFFRRLEPEKLVSFLSVRLSPCLPLKGRFPLTLTSPT